MVSINQPVGRCCSEPPELLHPLPLNDLHIRMLSFFPFNFNLRRYKADYAKASTVEREHRPTRGMMPASTSGTVSGAVGGVLTPRANVGSPMKARPSYLQTLPKLLRGRAGPRAPCSA